MSLPRVSRPQGGREGLAGCSFGLVSDPARVDVGQRRLVSFRRERDRRGRSLNRLYLTRRGRRDASSVTAHLISRVLTEGTWKKLTADWLQKGENNDSFKVDYLCRRRAAR